MNKDMYAAFNKALFPSGNIRIENIIKEAMPKPEEIKKETKNEIIVNPTDSVVDLPIPTPEKDKPVSISRKEKIYLERKEKKQLDKQQIKKTLKNTEKITRENTLNNLKNQTRNESSFSKEDLKRIERILFQK